MSNETKVKERPILFSSPMVRAILEGRKTQTRRKVKLPIKDPLTGCEIAGCEINSLLRQGEEICKHGVPGDRLWVRETFQLHTTLAGIRVTYREGEVDAWIEPPETWEGIPDDNHWRPCLFMPRWASRITLEIEAVRVERLQEIGEEDALAEGCNGDCPVGHIPSHKKSPCVYHYAQLWESINGPGSWDANPWVWVIQFMRVQP